MNLFQNVKYGVSCREAAERYLGIEPLINPRISENWGNSLCTYVPES